VVAAADPEGDVRLDPVQAFGPEVLAEELADVADKVVVVVGDLVPRQAGG
jgi:hypothetical protein